MDFVIWLTGSTYVFQISFPVITQTLQFKTEREFYHLMKKHEDYFNFLKSISLYNSLT